MRDIGGEVLFVAGEVSGDLHAAGVADAIRRLQPDRKLVGIGGNRMKAAGVQLLEHVDSLAVMGFVEVIKHVPHHWSLLGMLTQRLRQGEVALVILIDYAGFNMQVAKAARDAGVPVLYYVTPQVWASRAGRLPKLAKTVTKAACILPFEPALHRCGARHPSVSQRNDREQGGIHLDSKKRGRDGLLTGGAGNGER